MKPKKDFVSLYRAYFSIPSMSPVGTEEMALVCVLGNKFTIVKVIRKKNAVKSISEYF
jgi:hypothetical protein